jgi:hypothetical protein
MSSVKTTFRNPIVTIWDDVVSKDYDGEGILGSMNLSTAAGAYDFELLPFLGEEIVALGRGTRLRVSDKQYAKSGTGIYLEFNGDATTYWMAEDEAHPEHIKYDERGELI